MVDITVFAVSHDREDFVPDEGFASNKHEVFTKNKVFRIMPQSDVRNAGYVVICAQER